MNSIRTYSELIALPTFKERFDYLRLDGSVGNETFGFDRYLNQQFYHSNEWKSIRSQIIARDLGRDMAMDGFEIHGRIYIHHMNPLAVNDFVTSGERLLNPDWLVCVSHRTHNAIHYGDEKQLTAELLERMPNDTCPWRK